jgi:hypothetical protein
MGELHWPGLLGLQPKVVPEFALEVPTEFCFADAAGKLTDHSEQAVVFVSRSALIR